MRPIYIVEPRAISLMSAALGKTPVIYRKAYRWKWRARLAAFNARGFFGGIAFDSRVLTEWPSDNVVSLRDAA